MVGAERFELSTSSPPEKRSTKLSHAPTLKRYRIGAQNPRPDYSATAYASCGDAITGGRPNFRNIAKAMSSRGD